jgi:hypothetical protein
MVRWALQPDHRWHPSIQGGKGSIKLKIFAAVKRYLRKSLAEPSLSLFPVVNRRAGPSWGKAANNTFRRTFDKFFFEKSFGGGPVRELASGGWCDCHLIFSDTDVRKTRMKKRG